jgi:hypothetical protein
LESLPLQFGASTIFDPGMKPKNVPQLKLPENYRERVYLTTGFDMSYSPNAMQMDRHRFDNAFVNAEAYKAFVKTGTWPDKTMLVLENRMAQGKGSSPIQRSERYRPSL